MTKSPNPYIYPGLQLNERYVKSVVCRSYKINDDQLLLTRQPFTEARQVVMVLFMEYLGYSTTKAAECFGDKTHSTASHAKKTVYNLVATDRVFKHRFNRIKEELRLSL